MDLIIKPTGLCNFDCTFCSAYNLDIAHPTKVPNQIKSLITKLKPDNIILTGGEPLLVHPDYILKIQELSGVRVSLTSNMKDFYLNPDKWKEVVNHPMIGFITSFHYGTTRRWDKNTVYDEIMFRKVTEKFKEVTGGKSLPFIALIDESNEDLIFDHVYLAKDLDTQVKINATCKMGRQGKNYPKYKIIRAYLDIIHMGLDPYEITCSQRKLGRCSFNTGLLCSSTIRVCYIDSNDRLHYGRCEDEISIGEDGEIEMDTEFPVKAKIEIPSPKDCITDKCSYCELFRFCNGCHEHRKHAKEFPEYCEKMLEMKDEIIETDWAI